MRAKNTRFNSKVHIDFMNIEGASVLYLADEATHFYAAQFVSSRTTGSVRETILTLWATRYTRLQNTLDF